jgi:hypothetical protein
VVKSLVYIPTPGDQLTEDIFESGSIGLMKITEYSLNPILTSTLTGDSPTE